LDASQAAIQDNNERRRNRIVLFSILFVLLACLIKALEVRPLPFISEIDFAGQTDRVDAKQSRRLES
jgi:hypothetical protein